MTHKTKRIKLKYGMVDVDKAIVPLIRYMDSFPTVKTLYSCQGIRSFERVLTVNKPYVLFSSSVRELTVMLRHLEITFNDSRVVCEVGCTPQCICQDTSTMLKFTFTFTNAAKFKDMMDKLRSEGWKP